MRRSVFALSVAALSLSACVQTRQFADVEFAPPQGDYRLLVLRPDVSVGSVTTGGMVEPRADWTENARKYVTEAIRDQQAGRGGKIMVMERRDSLPGVSAEEVADVERLQNAVT